MSKVGAGIDRPKTPPTRKVNRLNYDYSRNGAYFITICSKDKAHIFGTVEASTEHSSVGAGIDRPKTNLTKIGIKVEEGVLGISQKYKIISVDKYVIMPNHVHMIITIDNFGRSMPAPTVSNIIAQLKSWVVKQLGILIWQKGFYDHVIRGWEDYENIWTYIDTNPDKWSEDKYYV